MVNSLVMIAQNSSDDMIIRLSEIEVYPEFLSDYLTFAKEIDRKSMEHEEGVICLYPVQLKEDSTQIRILEIYKNKDAYQKHIASEHFQKYKKGTLHMVKHLKLTDVKALDPDFMHKIFLKELSK